MLLVQSQNLDPGLVINCHHTAIGGRLYSERISWISIQVSEVGLRLYSQVKPQAGAMEKNSRTFYTSTDQPFSVPSDIPRLKVSNVYEPEAAVPPTSIEYVP